MGGQAKGVMQALRQQMTNGSLVEIAGYLVAPALAEGMEQAVLTPHRDSLAVVGDVAAIVAQCLVWLELTTRDNASLSPVSTQTLGQWKNAGFHVTSQLVQGPAFWQTTEIEDAPALIQATLTAATTPQSLPQSE
jgi:hypothetical protein